MANANPNQSTVNGRFIESGFNTTSSRKCSLCGGLKFIFEFAISKKTGRYVYTCRTCSRGSSDKYRRDNKVKTKLYRRAMHERHIYKRRYSSIKANAIKRGHTFTMTQEEFNQWLESTPKQCSYCDMDDPKLNVRFGRALAMFTIDRKNNDLSYTLDNICYACFDCNRTKSDVFTAEEFREIAQKYLKPKKLAKQNGER